MVSYNINGYLGTEGRNATIYTTPSNFVGKLNQTMITEHSTASKFMNLPAEVHALIAEKLAFPDLLALTLTHPHFRSHSLIHTSKTARVDWLIDRALHHLTLPSHGRCRWSSDCEFVSNPEIAEILRRRRKHLECAEVHAKHQTEGICLVLDGQLCPYLVERNHYLRNEKWMSALGFGKALDRRKRSERLFRAVTSWYTAGLALLLAGVLWLII